MKLRSLCALLILATAPALAAERSEVITRAFPAPAGKLVLVDAGPLDLAVRVVDINEIRLKVELVAAALGETQATAWIERHRPTVEDTEHELRIVAPDPGGLNLLKGVVSTRQRIELTLPPGVRPDLSTSSGTLRVDGEFPDARPLRLRTASGDAEFVGWVPEVEARSTSGDIQLHASRAFELVLARTSSGSVLLTGGARSARCDTSSGNVRLEGLLGPVGIATSSGNVVARFDALGASDEVRITTTSGKVRVSLPPASTPGGEVTSTKGEIRSIYPGESDPKGGKLTLSGVGPKLFVTTTSGRIDLN